MASPKEPADSMKIEKSKILHIARNGLDIITLEVLDGKRERITYPLAKWDLEVQTEAYAGITDIGASSVEQSKKLLRYATEVGFAQRNATPAERESFPRRYPSELLFRSPCNMDWETYLHTRKHSKRERNDNEKAARGAIIRLRNIRRELGLEKIVHAHTEVPLYNRVNLIRSPRQLDEYLRTGTMPPVDKWTTNPLTVIDGVLCTDKCYVLIEVKTTGTDANRSAPQYDARKQLARARAYIVTNYDVPFRLLRVFYLRAGEKEASIAIGEYTPTEKRGKLPPMKEAWNCTIPMFD